MADSGQRSETGTYIDELPAKPLLAGEEGVSMSLAGVQTKLGTAIDEQGRICIPLNGAPSTVILSIDSTDRSFGSAQNDALCLTLARAGGILTPDVTTGKTGTRTYLLVARYDRLKQGDRWRRLHQEDFCQALGKPPSAKSEANQTGIKGPTVTDMSILTRSAMTAADTLRFLDHLILNICVCNTDAHAKNYSLMISGRGFSMAPMYDVLCAAAWEGITQNLAQKIAAKNRGEHLKRRHWQWFAKECGLNPTSTIARVRSLAGKIIANLDKSVAAVEGMPAGTHTMLPKFRKAIEMRCQAVISGLDENSIDAVSTSKPARKSRPRSRKST